ncbi:hypothetical protein Taro_026319 [Colocasia esculenta]|uniref:Scarecrow-like protein 32 n=1 Tax=Colocasia esculenta TaxID=4460 RepID=A0A843VNA4_COLES|nr:hypothetical protein [Colocasia esculenta]
MKAEVRGSPRISLTAAPDLFNAPHGCFSGPLNGCIGSLDGTCTEKLLLHCAAALESNDVTLAQQVMWVLNNVAAAAGDPNQRLASWFLRALVARASRVYPHAAAFLGAAPPAAAAMTRAMSVTKLAAYVDLLPWHRFGFSAANGAICEAVQGSPRVHILDLSITHCMQWPTLIDELAKRPEGAPSLRITVPDARPPVPPLLNVSIEEVGLRLANFAQSREVPFEFHVLRSSSHTEIGDGGDPQTDPSRFPFQFFSDHFDPSVLDLRDDETLVVNCQNWLRYLPGEGGGGLGTSSDLLTKDGFLETIRGLNPAIVTVVDEDADLDSPSLSSRITACFNYLWIAFDALETFLPKDSPQRTEQEAAVGQKIENIVGFEGPRRIERTEPGARVAWRMKRAGFCRVAFGEETLKEVKFLLDEHAGGWGMKKEDDMLVLTWKGHSSVFVSAWTPAGFDE